MELFPAVSGACDARYELKGVPSFVLFRGKKICPLRCFKWVIEFRFATTEIDHGKENFSKKHDYLETEPPPGRPSGAAGSISFGGVGAWQPH
jgi:hypothetical protein